MGKNILIAAIETGAYYLNKNKNTVDNNRSINNSSSRDITLNEIILNPNAKSDSGIRRERKGKRIVLDKVTFEKDREGNIINESEKTTKKVIGNKISYIPKIEGIEIFGGAEIRQFDIKYSNSQFGENKSHRGYISINKKEDEPIKLVPKEDIVKNFRRKGFELKEEDIQLVFYKPELLNKLIPMYRIGSIKSGPLTKNGDHVLGSIYPANSKYENNFKVESFQINRGAKYNYKNNGDEGQSVSSSLFNYSAILKLSNLAENLNLDKLSLIGNFRNARKEILSDGSIKFEFIGNLESKKGNKVLINYLNQYDVSATRMTEVSNKVILPSKIVKIPSSNLPKINSILPKINSRGDNNDYGIEWGEDGIGGSCYSNFVNYMDTQATSMYKWTKPNAWRNDFWDKDKAGGLDHFYVDDVDTSVIIAHGNGDGFTMEGSGSNNGKVKYDDCAEGKAWGNIDLEFQIWLSCQVLEEDWGSPNLKWHQRWGPTFNGMHLICAFDTNANVGTHKQLEHFARFSQGDKKTIRRSWFDAGDLDQPDGRKLVVMGPCISQSTSGDYKSINYEGVKVAYYNDKAWKAGSNAAGTDINKSQIVGFWKVVHEV